MFHYYIEPKVISNLLTEDEIEYIKKESINKFVPSLVASGFGGIVDDNIRKSETAFLESNDPIVNSVVRKCVSLINKPFENAERLQVLRYKEGGRYEYHQDVCYQDKNKRLYTFIIALNDDYEGGETAFPNLNEKYKLNAGDALFFHTLDNYGLDTSDALHGGQPVKSGEKWVCNLWVHKYPYA